MMYTYLINMKILKGREQKTQKKKEIILTF